MAQLIFPIPPNDVTFSKVAHGPVTFCIEAMAKPEITADPSGGVMSYALDASNKYPLSGVAANSALWIMSGTRPTAAQVEASASSSAFRIAYSGQKLIEFRPLTYSLRMDVTNKQILITYSRDTVSPAVLTGTATWWAVGDYAASGINPLFVGDVSNLAGSGEVKLISTAITSGVNYLLTPFTFCVSSSVVLS